MSEQSETPQEVRIDRDRLERQYNEIAALAGGLAHEIRNPLSTISLNLDLLFEDLQTLQTPAAQRMLRKVSTIQKECEHLDEILEAFLQFARAGELSLEPCNVADLIRNFLEFYQPEAAQHHIDIRPHLAADLPTLQLDVRLIRQVLSNLVRNAQQAMPEGGIIEIQSFRRGGDVVIEIIDTGCGVPAAAVEKMFNVFFSTKPAGNGLGLPTVRKIVETHGGTIHCESEPGRGTKMTLTFPVETGG
ncbi:sensor histidine kinase [Planctomicrobium sp. SH661]|uniref:sensor histidine kinase n=1 Tax=Planctomicrobium sp. SH661 TaxID=3448124 RepID=UPI003F5C9657